MPFGNAKDRHLYVARQTEGRRERVIPFRTQKIENAVAYFASEFKKRRGFYPRQMWVYKFLALLDFRTLKKTGVPCLGLNYDAMEMGPVPAELYYARDTLKTSTYRFVRTGDGYRVDLLEEPNLDYFSDDELDEMDRIISTFLAPSSSLKCIIKDVHQEIVAWGKAWRIARENHRGKMPMDYADEFESLSGEKVRDLTPEEEIFLLYSHICSLENSPEAAAEAIAE